MHRQIMASLERLNDEIKKKRPHLKKKKALFHKDNAPCHKSIKTMAKLHKLGYELLPHPPYSPDLAPSNFFLFANLKRMVAGKKVSTNEEVIAETEYDKNGIEKIYDRYNRCIIAIIALEAEFERLLQNVFEYSEFKKIFEYVFEYSGRVTGYLNIFEYFKKGTRLFRIFQKRYSNISKKVFEYIRIFQKTYSDIFEYFKKGIRIFRICSNISKKVFEYFEYFKISGKKSRKKYIFAREPKKI
jgi:hypothetical protein